MKRVHIFVLLILLLSLSLFFPLRSYGQVQQVWQTIVGDPEIQTPPDEYIEPDIEDDGLGEGEFSSPFKCGNFYVGHTYSGHSNYAVDFNGASGQEEGEPVLASANGTVVVKIPECGQLIIRSEGGYYTTYVHMTDPKDIIREGDKVKLGQEIGKIGNVAVNREGYCRSDGPHLHTRQSKGGYLNEHSIKLSYRNTPYANGYPASIRYPSSDSGPGWKIGGQCK